MDFDLTDDQRLLKDSVDRLIADRYGFEDRKRYAREPEGWSRAMWRAFAELGLLGLPFSEDHGGFGGGAVETAIVQEAFGGALVLEPFFTTVVLCGGLLRRLASPEQRAALAPGVIAGETLLAYAQAERQSRYSLNDVMTQAEPSGDAWRITGEKSLVLHGDSADRFLVTARTAGEHRARHGIGLFLVDAGAPGVTRRGYPTQDGLLDEAPGDRRHADRCHEEHHAKDPGGLDPTGAHAQHEVVPQVEPVRDHADGHQGAQGEKSGET